MLMHLIFSSFIPAHHYDRPLSSSHSDAISSFTLHLNNEQPDPIQSIHDENLDQLGPMLVDFHEAPQSKQPPHIDHNTPITYMQYLDLFHDISSIRTNIWSSQSIT